MSIGDYETAMRFTKGNHAFIAATHTDRAHIHNHIIFNSTSLDCTHKFRDFFFVKEAFDELHVKKLPKVKELNAEYAQVLAEKKKLYGEYRQAKKDMQKIQRAKYDIDQFLKDDEEQKKERTRKRGITL